MRRWGLRYCLRSGGNQDGWSDDKKQMCAEDDAIGTRLTFLADTLKWVLKTHH